MLIVTSDFGILRRRDFGNCPFLLCTLDTHTPLVHTKARGQNPDIIRDSEQGSGAAGEFSRHSLRTIQNMAGWFTSKAGSLIHPLVMMGMVLLWIVTWLLGLQVRRVRSEEGTPLLSMPRTVRDRYHHKLSAALLFLTMFTMFLGMYNTYLRSGRLFPSPHMYGGFFFLLAISLNVAMVPWFKDTPSIRTFHAIVGFVVVLTLVSQVWSGLPILKSVWKTVPW